jgi:3'-5' exoribonuclease
VRRVDVRGDHLELILGDRTGTVPARVARGAGSACRPGGIVFVTGRLSDSWLVIHTVREAEEHEYAPEDLYDGPSRGLDQMESDLRELLATVQNAHLRQLLSTVFADTWPEYRDSPAGKRFHHAYRHGLLEHSLTVAQAVGAIAATFTGIDRDVAVTGALLHDIGKLEAYEWEAGPISMSDHGRLQGEISLGYYRVRRAIEDIPGFPPQQAEALLHIILSHHGQLEHGSPVVPCTREATLVHMIDNLGGKLGSFDRIEKGLSDGEIWSGFDRALSGAAFFASRRTAPETQEAEAA